MWMRTVAGAIAIVFLVAGCGGSTNAGSSTATAGTATATRTRAGASGTTSPASTSTTTQSTSQSTTAQPAGGPVPVGFAPRSFTATGELTWWLLGTAPCSTPPCTSIVRTVDGGRSFVGIPAPRARLTAIGPATAGVSQLRFADARDGFAYGGLLYVTHDGGASWHRVNLGGWIPDLAIAAGQVYAIVSPAAGGGPARLMRSPVGKDSWSTLHGSVAVDGLWAHGNDLLAESAPATSPGRLLVSHNLGASFTSYATPPSVACHYEEPATAIIWANCATGMLSAVSRSTDYGAHFAPAVGGSGARALPPQPNSAAFAAASSTTAVVGSQRLYRTADAGASYQPVGPTGITWQYLGFTDATHGVALGYAGSDTPSHEHLYYTTDGGATYHLVTIG